MDPSCIFFGFLFVSIGIVFFTGKGLSFLSAWKNTPQEEKEKIRIAPLCHNVGAIIALNGVIFLLKGFIPGFTRQWFSIAIIAWLVLACVDVWYISNGNHYHKITA